MNVLDKYKAASLPKPFPWKPFSDEPVKAQMAEYISAGLVRELKADEIPYGKAQPNFVVGSNQRLRATMDAREINKFFCPPPF